MMARRGVFFYTLFSISLVLGPACWVAGKGTGGGAQTTVERIDEIETQLPEQLRGRQLATAMEYINWLRQHPDQQAVGVDRLNELLKDVESFKSGNLAAMHEIRDDLRLIQKDMAPSQAAPGTGSQTNPQQGGPSGQTPGSPSSESQAHGDPQTWREIEGLTGESAPVKTELARAYLLAGQPQNALDAATKAALMDPKYAPAYSVMGKAYYDLGDLKNAHLAANKALSLGASDNMALTVAKLTFGRGEPSKPMDPAADKPPPAREDSRFLGIPGNPPVPKRDNGAEVARLFELKDYEGAAALLSRAVIAEPRDFDLRLTLISALTIAKRYKEALAAADDALLVFPNNSKLLSSRAKIHNFMGKADLALLDADKAIQEDKDNADAWLHRGFALDGLGGRRQEKRDSFFKAAALYEKYRGYYEQAMTLADGELARRLMGEGSQPKPAAKRQGGWAGLSPTIKRGLIIGVSSLLGGLFLALGLMGLGSQELKTNIRRFFAGLRKASPRVESVRVDAAADSPGRTIAGSYQVVRKIGIGGMGVVYEGLDTALGRRVAVKKMREELRLDQRERERFLQEARTVATLHHPNIVDIYAIVDDGQDAYLVFEFVDGKTLSDVLQSRKRLPYAEALSLTKGVATALEYAHGKNVVHRDLKPSNIMVSAERQVKVMDFGVARQAKDCMGRLSLTNTVVGTPPYMAPEQEQGMVGRGADIYALAVCFYELLSGELPFGGVGAGMLLAKMNKTYIPLSRRIDGLPQGLDSVLDKALDPDPTRRQSSAGEFYKELAALVSKNGK